MLVQYGRPAEVLPLSSGNRVDGYHREMQVSAASGGSFANGYAATSSSNSDSRTIYCDRRFEIDSKTLKVVRAVISGSHCDFSQ